MPVVNLKTDYGAIGNTQDVTAILSIAAGSHVLSSTTSLWASGDVGKLIGVQGAGVSGGILRTTISGFTDAKNITLTAAASTALSAVSSRVVWGNDDSNAIAAFNAANAGLSNVSLTIPAGIYSMGSVFQGTFGGGIRQFVATGAGAANTKITNYAAGGNIFFGSFLGVHNVAGGGTWQANTQTTAVGQNYVDLLDPTLTSIFTVGNWVLMTGFDVQGLWTPNGFGFGFPPNLQFYEYVQITSIDSNGRITFSAPLKYLYKSTWPLWDKGGNFGPYEGGPATLYWLSPNWNIDATFDGITTDAWNANGTGSQIAAIGRKIAYNNCVSLGNGVFPTQDMLFSATNSDWSQISDPNGLEFDKLIATVNLTSCNLHRIKIQSSSPLNLNIDQTTLDTIEGTPANLKVTSSTVSTKLALGVLSYGRTDTIELRDSTIASVVSEAATSAGGSTWTLSGNTIVFPNGNGVDGQNAVRCLSPGAIFSFVVGGRLSRVLDVTQDATNCSVTVSDVQEFQAGGPQFKAHPCPNLTVVNCTGSDDIVAFSQAPAGQPIYSFNSRTYTNLPSAATNPLFTVWGALKSATFNVTKPYTGVRSSLFFNLSFFNNWPYFDSSDVQATYGPVINLKTAGLRTIIPGQSTVGAQAGDASLSIPANSWFRGHSNSGPSFSANIGGEDPSVWPSITVTMQADQGIVQPIGFVSPIFWIGGARQDFGFASPLFWMGGVRQEEAGFASPLFWMGGAQSQAGFGSMLWPGH